MGLKRDVPFRTGGPVFGLGARFDGTGEVGVIGRLGYEIAAPANLILGLYTDTDFYHFGTLAMTAEGAFGTYLFGTIGGGPVVELGPQVRPGLRLSTSAGAYVVALTGAFDIYFSPEDVDFRGILAVQAGF